MLPLFWLFAMWLPVLIVFPIDHRPNPFIRRSA